MTFYKNKIPPDGGWGWMVVLANVISNIFSTTALSNFGLVFSALIDGVHLPTSVVTTIITTSTIMNILTGLISGPLIKYFGCRKVSFVAGCLFSIGLILCSYVTDNIIMFVMTFGVMTAIGYGLATCSFPQALSEYFSENRTKAMSLSITFTGLGPVLFPPLLAYLLSIYGIQGCVLIWGALGLHIIFASFLLQPVKYHLKEKPAYAESKNIFIVSSDQMYKYKSIELKNNSLNTKQASTEVSSDKKTEWQTKKPSFISQLDLDIFKDKIYINIIIGMSFVACADMNFTIFAPFILSELGFSTIQIASIMTIVGICDIIFRYLSQFFKKLFNMDSRMLYLISVILVIFSRSAIFFATSYTHLVIIGIGLGASKGARSVCSALILPEYVPIEKLAVANGMRKFLNSLWMLCFIPLIANMRTATNGYLTCIVYINLFTIICVILWIGELMVKYLNPYRKRKISLIPY